MDHAAETNKTAATRTTPVDYRTLQPLRCGDGGSVALEAIDVSVAFDDRFTVAAFVATVPSAVSAVRQRGLHVASLTSVAAPHDIAARSSPPYAEASTVARELLDAAAALNARFCIIPAPSVVPNADSDDPQPTSYGDALNGTFRVLTCLAEPAAAAGVIVAVRAPSGGCLLSPVEVRELVDSIHSPNVSVCVDAGALQRVGQLDDWARVLRHRIGCLRNHWGQSAFRR